ncbi:uncharacterized protein LOC112043876 [Bicyclus anynana]|uniref:Uncharacterized protein LOC112043876 n=1 Tax=Bicyclus anynana TaxID=110368 RepID=A0ABM3LV96_BICAN|nr:uncharacterized protein LOC112043876 [Bicyclus anynana]
MCFIYGLFSLVSAVVGAATDNNNYKDQFCTDPRTMERHEAYSEWPDSYSCTRHRCQPGGRNLAIYTVGCKRVEAPESAIECEEVVEDTNMQFPFCCTRLRCLVVVRGEVWTRVLGQPWETLPAAPWSHMYKMKKPPPENDFKNKNAEQGPVYELQRETERDEVLRASKKSSPTTDCDDGVARAVAAPDIVIALSTPNDEKKKKNEYSRLTFNILHSIAPNFRPNLTGLSRSRHKKSNTQLPTPNDADTNEEEHIDIELDDLPANEKTTWTEIPQSQWTVHDPSMDIEHAQNPRVSPRSEKPSGLQALVDAIGNRMRDIESVVQRMSEKVHNKQDSNNNELSSAERVNIFRSDGEAPKKHQKSNDQVHEEEESDKEKKISADTENYKRFSVKGRGSQYLRSAPSSEKPAGADDALNGYFSDASNSLLRRSPGLKEPVDSPLTYVAPVENRRKSHDVSEEDKKHKKHSHKKKRKGKSHKRHHKEEKKKHFNRLVSAELDRVSLEDSAIL